VNDKIPEDDLPRLDKYRLTPSPNLKKGFDKTSSLKLFSGDYSVSGLSEAGIYRNFLIGFSGLRNAGKSL
jgi:hypothetical protein